MGEQVEPEYLLLSGADTAHLVATARHMLQ
jgi:hypothetical protein